MLFDTCLLWLRLLGSVGQIPLPSRHPTALASEVAGRDHLTIILI